MIIRFVNEPDIIAKLITWQTDSLWCHTEALSRDGQSWIGAHAGTGVEARALDWCKTSRERQYLIPLKPAAEDAAMSWLESKIGCQYNYADIVGLALHKRMTSEHEVICSALMLEYMQQAGLQPLNVMEGYQYLVTPETLHLSPLFIGRQHVPVDTGGFMRGNE